MKKLSTTEKGNVFEREVFDFFREYVLGGEYSINPAKCEFYHKKAYYSHKRKSDIEVDIAIEVHAQNKDNLSLLVVVECKNYNHPVGVEDIEEFDSKLRQISGRNVKGIVFTKVGYRKGALEYARSIGIALAKLISSEQVDWVLERTPLAVEYGYQKQSKENEIIEALTNPSYRGQSEKFFAICNQAFSFSLDKTLDELIPEEYRQKINTVVKYSSMSKTAVPFIGQESIERRIDGIFIYFGRKLFGAQGVDLSKICDYLSDKMKTDFIFDEDLGINADGLEILGKFNLDPFKIFINKNLEENSPRWRFTLAHEIGHFLYHRNFYQIQPEMSRAETDSSISWRAVKNNLLFRLEWQANTFASALLLPRNQVYSSVVAALKEYGVNRFTKGVIFLDEQRENIVTYHRVLLKLRREYGASRQAIIYRLAQLKLVNNQSKNRTIADLVDNTLEKMGNQ